MAVSPPTDEPVAEQRTEHAEQKVESLDTKQEPVKKAPEPIKAVHAPALPDSTNDPTAAAGPVSPTDKQNAEHGVALSVAQKSAGAPTASAGSVSTTDKQNTEHVATAQDSVAVATVLAPVALLFADPAAASFAAWAAATCNSDSLEAEAKPEATEVGSNAAVVAKSKNDDKIAAELNDKKTAAIKGCGGQAVQGVLGS